MRQIHKEASTQKNKRNGDAVRCRRREGTHLVELLDALLVPNEGAEVVPVQVLHPIYVPLEKIRHELLRVIEGVIDLVKERHERIFVNHEDGLPVETHIKE